MNRFANMRSAPYVFFALYALVWTVTATLSDESYHFDIQEEIAWGKEWLIGLYRHPPMKVWLLEIANQISGFAKPTPYFLATVLFGLGQIALYTALADVVSRRMAFIAVLSTTAIYLFGSRLPLWNANTVQFVFVGLFLLSVWRALDRRSAFWMVLAGAAAAGGTLGKYSFLSIVAPVAIWALLVPDLRRRIPWVGLGAGVLTYAVLITPTALWLVNEGEAAFRFIENRVAAKEDSVLGTLRAASEYLLVLSGLLAAPILFLLIGVRGTRPKDPQDDRLRLAFQVLGAAAVGSHAIVLLMIFLNGTVVRDHWLMASLMTVPPFAMLALHRASIDVVIRPLGTLLAALWLATIVALYPLERYVNLESKPPERPFAWFPVMPSEPLVIRAQAFWEEAAAKANPTSDAFEPRPAFISGGLVGALLANIYPGRPSWLEGGSPVLSPWISNEMLKTQAFLSIGPMPQELVRAYDLCVIHEERYVWENVRGQPARIIRMAALGPREACIDPAA